MLRRLFLALTPCAGAALHPAWAQSPSWQTIADPSGRYSLEMPAPARQRTSNGPNGSTLHHVLFTWDRGGLDFTFHDFTRLNPDQSAPAVEAGLDGAERNVRARWPGSTVLQQADIRSGPAQGRAFTLSIEGGKRVLAFRAYYHDRRLYLMQAETTPDEQNSPIVTRFFNSLRIIS